jgi:hypothetical protein
MVRRAVGWAKARLRRAHHLRSGAGWNGGHAAGRFASADFAHPTHCPYVARQFFSRYPVLKIHHTVIMQIARNRNVMPTLKPTLTSAIS